MTDAGAESAQAGLAADATGADSVNNPAQVSSHTFKGRSLESLSAAPKQYHPLLGLGSSPKRFGEQGEFAKVLLRREIR